MVIWLLISSVLLVVDNVSRANNVGARSLTDNSDIYGGDNKDADYVGGSDYVVVI